MKEQTMESMAYTSFCSLFNFKSKWLGKTFKDKSSRGRTAKENTYALFNQLFR